MEKCLVTKLIGSINNDDLPILGQLKFQITKSNVVSKESRGIVLRFNAPATISVSGAHFTDDTISVDEGNVKKITDTDLNKYINLYFSNDEGIVTIDNKYALTVLYQSIDFYNYNAKYGDKVVLDLDDCTGLEDLISFDFYSSTLIKGNLYNLTKYSKKLNMLLITNANSVIGDLSNLSDLKNLSYLRLTNTGVTGDLSNLSNLTSLAEIVLNNTEVYGDISSLSSLTKLTLLNLGSVSGIYGDISSLSSLTNLTQVLTINSHEVYGDISSLSSLTKLPNIILDGTQVYGDISKLSSTCIYFTCAHSTKQFSWTAQGRQNVKFLSLGGYIPLDQTSMDNMLIDEATCNVSSNYYKSIVVKGTRTSASDEAVTTLQNMGVTITGVTKVS